MLGYADSMKAPDYLAINPFAKSVKKVIVRGDRMANILYGKGESLRMVRGDNGVWKAAP